MDNQEVSQDLRSPRRSASDGRLQLLESRRRTRQKGRKERREERQENRINREEKNVEKRRDESETAGDVAKFERRKRP